MLTKANTGCGSNKFVAAHHGDAERRRQAVRDMMLGAIVILAIVATAAIGLAVKAGAL